MTYNNYTIIEKKMNIHEKLEELKEMKIDNDCDNVDAIISKLESSKNKYFFPQNNNIFQSEYNNYLEQTVETPKNAIDKYNDIIDAISYANVFVDNDNNEMKLSTFDQIRMDCLRKFVANKFNKKGAIFVDAVVLC